MANVGTGWIPDPAKGPGEKPDRDAAPLLGVSSIPVSGSARAHILSILNQGPASSCVANAGMQAIRADQHRQGAEAPRLGSRWWGYFLARSQHGAQHEDNGTYLRAFFNAMNKFGFPPEDVWPYRFDIVEDLPRWAAVPSTEAFRAAHDQRLPLAYHRITEVGYARVDAVKRAVSQGRCVCYGTMLDKSWEDYDGESLLDVAARGSEIGGHAMVIAEYEGDEFRGPNTWGTEWGVDGWFRAKADLIAHPSSGDFWVVQTAPIFTE